MSRSKTLFGSIARRDPLARTNLFIPRESDRLIDTSVDSVSRNFAAMTPATEVVLNFYAISISLVSISLRNTLDAYNSLRNSRGNQISRHLSPKRRRDNFASPAA